MLQQLETLYSQAQTDITSITSQDALQNWEGKYIGRKGEMTTLLRSVGQLPQEERAAFGKRANEIKAALEELFTARETLVRQQELAKSLEAGETHATLPRPPTPSGRPP